MVATPKSKYKFQGKVYFRELALRVVPSNQENNSANKRSRPPQVDRHVLDLMLVDSAGPVYVSLWDEAGSSCFNQLNALRSSPDFDDTAPVMVSLSSVVVANISNNAWNGPCLTKMRTLHSVPAAGQRAGTAVVLNGPITSPHVSTGTIDNLPSELCISNFAQCRELLAPPFRGTFRGTIADVMELDYSAAGLPMRYFKLVDPNGYYLDCCASRHNALSEHLVDNVDAILFFATGRNPLGNSPGCVFVMKEGMLVGLRENLFPPKAVHCIEIVAGNA